MPAKREIQLNFMGLKLTDVVQDLHAEWELRFWSRLLATALLGPLFFEELDLSLLRQPMLDIDCRLVRGMITTRSLALDVLDDTKRILHDDREMLMSSDRSMRIVLLFPESKTEDQLAVAVQDNIMAVLPSEEDATGNICSRGLQAFSDLGLDSLLHSGTVCHQNILNRASFCTRVEHKSKT